MTQLPLAPLAALRPLSDPANEEASLFQQLASPVLSGLSAVGNLLDLPSSVLRDIGSSIATRRFVNPLDQILHPFSHSERGLSTSGRDLLTQFKLAAPNKETGIGGWLEDPLEAVRDIAGFGLEVGLDVPGFGLAKQLAKGTRKAAASAPVQAATDALVSTRAGQAASQAAESVRKGVVDPVVDYGLAAFSKPVLEGLGPEQRALGRRISSGREEASVRAMETMAPVLEPFGRHLHELDVPSQLRAHRAIFRAMEGVEDLPAEMAHLTPELTKAKQIRDSQIARAEAAGVKLNELQDPSGIEHAVRERFFFPGDEQAGRGRGSRILSGRMESQIGRKEFLTDLWEGTSTVNDLSVDPRFAGVAHAMKPSELTGPAGKAFWDAQEKALDQVLQAGGHNQGYEHTRQLARWLADLNPEHVKQQIPVFPHNPIEGLARREIVLEETIDMANVMRETMARQVTDVDAAPIGAVRARDAFEAAGLDVDKSMELLRKQAGVADAADDLYIPKELAQGIGRVSKALRDPSETAEGIFGFARKATQFWKGTVTDWPAFRTRNATSALVMNKLDGVHSWKSVRNVARLLDDKPMSDVDWSKLGDEFAGLTNEAASRKFAHQFYADQVAPKRQGIALEGMPESRFSGSAADIPGVAPMNLRTAIKEGVVPLKGVLTGKRPADEFTEAVVRGSAYLERRLQGASRAEARAKTRASHVDYSDLTPFERKYIRPFMPFYAFSKGISKKVASELYENPGFAIKDGKVTGRLSTAIRAQHEATTQELPLPSYVGQTGAIPWGELPTGDNRYITSLGLMHEDPLQLFGGGPMGIAQEVLSRAHPLPKFIVEAVTGESLFQRGPLGGRELSEADPTLGRLLTNLGLRDEVAGRAQPVISNTFEHALANSPAARLLTTARTLTDPRKRLGETILPGEALLPALTGLRVTDVSPEAQEIAVRQHADRIARDELGARSFTRTYFPDDLVNETRLRSPEDAERIDVIEELYRQADRRYRQRRRRERAATLQAAVAP